MTDATDSGTPLHWHKAQGHGLTRRLRRALAARRPGAAESVQADRLGIAYPLGQQAELSGEIGSGTRLCRHVDLYHDGDAQAVACACDGGQALSLSCGDFGGSYLSLVAAVPDSLVVRFAPGRLLRLSVEVTASRPITTYLRLNVGSADGHETFYETLLVHRGARVADFDLDGLRLPFDGALHAWADIIFGQPAQAQIAVGDLCLRLIGKDEI